jgi:heme A synthase
MKRLSTAAFALAALTFALVVLGGIVHNTGSSLACPDWPLCNGSAFPRMAGAILIEHGHRLTALAVVVGTIALFSLLAAWSSDRGAVKAAGLGLGLVIVQALLGAITVKFRLPPLVSTGHLATSMLFFSTVIYLAFRLRQNAAPSLSPRVQQLTLTATVLIYAQMVLGAAVRHLGAGLVCREWVSCKGWLGADYTMQLHMAHRIFAVIVLGFVVYTSVIAWKASRNLLALLAPILVVLQMSLGLITIFTYRDIVPLTAHLAVAALLFADVLALHLISRGPLAETDEEPVGVAVTA